ncbi:MAG: hypothetical protein KF819_17530 [Labilithrix sp.]|nr:hypothetical protein [Labilithrix sp.]
MKRLALLLLVLAGCAAAPPQGTPKPPATAAPSGPPPCPATLIAGGDPIEAESLYGKPVARVCVIGASDDTRRAAENVVSLKPGDAVDAERMKIDLEAIFRLGVFDDASVYGLSDGGVTLVFVVRERPRIGEVVFEGAKLLGDAALSKKFPIEKQAPYDPARVHELAEAVRDEYRARGYESCEVRQIAEPLDGGLVRVKLKVTEGPLRRYAKIAFKGNAKVSEADLQKAAALKAGKPFVQEEIDRAAMVVAALYYDRGMIQVRVNVEHGPPQKDGGLDVVFSVDEGDVFHVGALRATKLGAPLEKELLARIKARPKQTFARYVIAKDVQDLRAWFESKGQRVEINPITDVDVKKKTIDVTFEVEAVP